MHSSPEDVIGHSSLSDSFPAEDNHRERAAEAANSLAGLKQSIRQLKSIMLSLEWDLSVETLRQLEEEIATQQARWQDDKSVTGLLRILGALGKYIGQSQARTHPLVIKLFFAVYNGLEKVVLSPDMSAAKKKKIMLLAYQRYNEVKAKLALREKLIAQEQQAAAEAPSQGEAEGGPVENAPVSISPAGASLEKSAEDIDSEGSMVLPALGGVDFSSEDEEKRKIWLENGESGDVSSRLSSFFGEDEESGQQAAPDAPEESGSSQEEEKKGVIDAIFSQNEESPADQLLTDIHLSVFSSEGEMPPPVSLQNPQQDVADTGEQSNLDAQVTEKLDAFFDESAQEAEAGAGEEAETAPPANEESCEKVSDEAFSGDVQEKLDNFFDGDGENEIHPDDEVVPLQPPATPSGSKPSELLQELLKEIKQQSDGYKHFPEVEERGLLDSLFERAEKAFQDRPEVLIPLFLLNSSLFSFEGSNASTISEALECAAGFAGSILSLSDGREEEKKDISRILIPLKKFLAMLEANGPRSQDDIGSKNSDNGNPDHQDGPPLSKKKSRPASQYKAKGDLIIEDLFSDEG